MKSSIRTFSLLAGIVWSVVPGIDAQVNVTQEHNNLSRDGLYIDAAFTPAAAAGLTRDLNFDGTIIRQCLRATALHRGRSQWADDYCRHRIQ